MKDVRVLFWRDLQAGYIAESLEVDLLAQGDTLEHALRNIHHTFLAQEHFDLKDGNEPYSDVSIPGRSEEDVQRLQRQWDSAKPYEGQWETPYVKCVEARLLPEATAA